MKFLIATGMSLVLCLALSGSSAFAEDDIEANKALVLAFYKMVLMDNKVEEAFERYVGEHYIQHNPNLPDGKEAAIKALKILPDLYPGLKFRIVRVIAEGDMVVLHIHNMTTAGEGPSALVEMFRVENGKVIEHWDISQKIPEKSLNDNSMF